MVSECNRPRSSPVWQRRVGSKRRSGATATPRDTTPPTAPYIIYASGLRWTGECLTLTVGVQRSTDDVTPQSALMYEVFADGASLGSPTDSGVYSAVWGVLHFTSDSAPITAGTAALIWSKYPTLTADDVVWRILSTAHDVGKPGVDRETGWGVIDPVAALATNVPASPGSAASARPGAAATCADPRMVPPACSKVSIPPDSSSAAGPAGMPAALITVVAASVALALAGGVGAALWYRRRRAGAVRRGTGG
jgi:hypothetical protein